MSREYTLQRAPAAARISIDYAGELNEQQYAAVTAPPGPLLVIAGAGSGKTRTLTYRVAYLLENGVDPRNILLLTFTNKAARQMLDRVANLLPTTRADSGAGPFIPSATGCCAATAALWDIRADSPSWIAKTRRICSTLWSRAAESIRRKSDFRKGDVLADIFSFVVNTERPIEELLAEKFPVFPAAVGADQRCAARATSAEEKSTNSLDFDDLLEKTLRMLKEHEEIAEFYRRQFQFILVDEYQDTNKIQADFIDLLAAEHRNVMVVGDDAQSIYSWRGANFQNILAFPRALSKCAGLQDRAELPERARDPGGRQRRHRGQRAAIPQTAERYPPNELGETSHGRLERWRRAGAVRRPADPRAARRGDRVE